ncbi:MAG: hypothetical protein ACI8XV_001836 [Arenicella sp.]|jgi:hypothetical protein
MINSQVRRAASKYGKADLRTWMVSRRINATSDLSNEQQKDLAIGVAFATLMILLMRE